MSAPAAMTRIILPEAELAKRLNICPRTAMRWRVTGEGPPFIRIGVRRVGYRLADVEAWEAARTFPHRAAEMAQKISIASTAM